MSGYKIGAIGGLFDPNSGAFAGALDANGREQMISARGAPGRALVAWVGDSEFDLAGFKTTFQQHSNFAATWARILSSQKIISPFSLQLGISGATTTSYLPNVNAIAAAQPDFAVVLLGTNDISGGASFATITGNLGTIYDTLTRSGVTVVAMPILPRSFWAGGGSLPTAQRRQIQAVNTWIRQRVQSTPGMVLADPTMNMVDFTNGDPIGGGVLGTPPASSAYTYDGLHPSPRGAYWCGKAVADALDTFIRNANTLVSTPNDDYSATDNPTGNIMNNPFLVTASGGTAGTGVTGTVVGSYTVQRQAGTTGACTASVITKTAANGQTYNAQRLVISAAAGAATERFQMLQQRFVAGLIGKQVYAECEIAVSGITGVNAIREVQLRCTDGTTNAEDNTGNTTYMQPDVAWSGVLRTQPFPLAAAIQQVELRIAIDGTVASAGITVDVSRLAFRAAA